MRSCSAEMKLSSAQISSCQETTLHRNAEVFFWLLFVDIIFVECTKIVINMHFRHFPFVLNDFRLAGLL